MPSTPHSLIRGQLLSEVSVVEDTGFDLRQEVGHLGKSGDFPDHQPAGQKEGNGFLESPCSV